MIHYVFSTVRPLWWTNKRKEVNDFSYVAMVFYLELRALGNDDHPSEYVFSQILVLSWRISYCHRRLANNVFCCGDAIVIVNPIFCHNP